MSNYNLPTAEPGHKQVMIVAGEASGDLHAANLIGQMRRQYHSRQIDFLGIGGREMKQAGVDIIVEASRLSVVGITEVFVRLPDILRGMSTAKNALFQKKPDLLIIIDFPDFNLRLAAHAKKAGVPVFYYITPQVWAWRQSRIKTIKDRVDQAAVIFPFEEKLFQQHDVPATFVGHPLLDGEYDHLPESESDKPKPQDMPDTITIALLPGSRNKEVQRHLPVMLAACKIINRQLPSTRFLISCAHSVDAEHLAQLTDAAYGQIPFKLVPGKVGRVLEKSDLAIAVSGTVTLEAALFAVPMIIIYRVSALSYLLARMLISVPHFSLVNIVAEKEIAPELLQSEVNAKNIATHICNLATDSERYQAMKDNLWDLRDKLGGPGASARAAKIALDMLHS